MAQRSDGKGLIDDAYVGETDVRKLINDHLERARGGDRHERDLMTYVNIRWHRNKPFYRLNELGRIQQIKPEFRGRYVPTNLLFESIRTVTGALAYQPRVEPFVKQYDRGDFARARMMAAIGNHVAQKMPRPLSHAQVITQLGGYCAIKPIWDPGAGEVRPGFENVPCPNCGGTGVVPGPVTQVACYQCSGQALVQGPDGQERGGGEIVQETRGKPIGDVTWEVVPPWEVFPDADAPSLHASDAVLQRTKMTPARFWALYGKKAGFRQEDFRSEGGGDLDIGGAVIRGQAGFQRSDENSFWVYEYWKNPDEKHPDGLFAIMAQDKVVIATKYPTPIPKHPFFFMTAYELWGTLYPAATADLILPLCQTINDHVSAQHVRDRLAAKLRYIYPRESMLKVDEATGQVTFSHAPGRPLPQPAQLPPSQQGMEFVNWLWEVVKSHAAAADVMRGQASSGVDSGVAMAWAEDRSLRQLSDMIFNQAQTFEGAIRYAIDLFWHNADDGRRLRTAGVGGVYEVHEFSVGAVGESDDVRLVLTKDIGRSRAAKMQEADNALKLGAIDAKTYQRITELGDSFGLNKRWNMNANQANMEYQQLIKTGMMPPPTELQLHEAHIEQHELQSIELESEDPNHPGLPILLQHVAMTKQLQANEAFKEQQRMAQAAAQFGATNAADPNAQPQTTQAASDAVFPQGGPPGSQPSLLAAQQSRTEVQGGGE